MNFAIPFTRKFNYFNQPNVEINIHYKPKVKELDDFISRYKQKRINLIFQEGEFDKERDLPLIEAFREKYPQCELVMRLPVYSRQIQSLLAQKQLPHYYYILANRWGIFNGLLNTSVTDIYISEDLCFSLDIIQQKVKDKNKKIRTFCNVCQTTWPEEESLRTFYGRKKS